jgi:hypothetical protein
MISVCRHLVPGGAPGADCRWLPAARALEVESNLGFTTPFRFISLAHRPSSWADWPPSGIAQAAHFGDYPIRASLLGPPIAGSLPFLRILKLGPQQARPSAQEPGLRRAANSCGVKTGRVVSY